jgi:aryl-alcohol dehydrogenase-like predicted oxidoreductase
MTNQIVTADASVTSRLVLGTVQFGLPYGVTNQRGQVTPAAAMEILSEAHAAGILLVDTAAGYGTSEALLGECLPQFPEIGVITKTPAIPDAVISAGTIEKLQDSVFRSRKLLGRRQLDALLLQSVYDAEEIDRILELFSPDVIQLPLNLFDQRLIRSGHIAMLRARGIEIHARSAHARSAFLQGVLLEDFARLSPYFHRFVDSFQRYDKFLDDHQISRLRACLGFMIEQSGADRIVVGVTGADELAHIVTAARENAEVVLPVMSELACFDDTLIDPRTWPPATPRERQKP